ADWTLSAAGATPLSGSTPVDSGATFSAGAYTLSESGPANYTASDWVCVGGTQGDATHITVGLGQSATCTITNNDQPAHLTLLKVVNNNHGGPLGVGSFPLTAVGTSTTATLTPITGQISGTALATNVAVNAGTYTLSEPT